MTKKLIVDTLRRILGDDVRIDVQPECTYVTSGGGDLSIDYDGMLLISQALGTTMINMRFVEGWGGTEVTPGDPSFCEIVIGVGAIR